MEKKGIVTAVVIGCGNRGSNYASYALDVPDELKIVAVADPKETARCRLQKWFGLPPDKIFTSWEEVARQAKLADCVIIATQDQMHREPAIAFAALGYNILLEKPMAVTEEDCRAITDACEEHGVLLAICHVLRYFPPVAKLKQLIMEGVIGDVVNIQHTENVGFWHFAHSFVRGNWRNRSESTFSLLAKCCHDMDLICYWMGEAKCTKLSSTGSLFHFKKDKQPKDASDNCLTCAVESTCPYSAKKIYLGSSPLLCKWPMSVVCDMEDLKPELYKEEVEKALRSGPYGRCVYECDNDVFDNQVVNMQFDNGATASLTMIAFTKELCERTTRIWGTKGELSWYGTGKGPIYHYDFLTNNTQEILPDAVVPPRARCSGHDGADFFLVKNFLQAVRTGSPTTISSGPRVSLASHLLVFAAQDALEQDKVAIIRDDNTWELQ